MASRNFGARGDHPAAEEDRSGSIVCISVDGADGQVAGRLVASGGAASGSPASAAWSIAWPSELALGVDARRRTESRLAPRAPRRPASRGPWPRRRPRGGPYMPHEHGRPLSIWMMMCPHSAPWLWRPSMIRPVVDDPAADAGAEREHDQARDVPPGADPVFAVGRGVGVVLEARSACRAARRAVGGSAGCSSPGRLGGSSSMPRADVHRARRAEADAGDVVPRQAAPLDGDPPGPRPGSRARPRARARPRSGSARSTWTFRPRSSTTPALDVRAPQVDPEEERRLRFLGSHPPALTPKTQGRTGSSDASIPHQFIESSASRSIRPGAACRPAAVGSSEPETPGVRTRDPAPTEPERAGYVRLRAASCGRGTRSGGMTPCCSSSQSTGRSTSSGVGSGWGASSASWAASPSAEQAKKRWFGKVERDVLQEPGRPPPPQGRLDLLVHLLVEGPVGRRRHDRAGQVVQGRAGLHQAAPAVELVQADAPGGPSMATWGRRSRACGHRPGSRRQGRGSPSRSGGVGGRGRPRESATGRSGTGGPGPV